MDVSEGDNLKILEDAIQALKQRRAEIGETMTERISESQFKALTRPLIGLPVTKTWRGYGTAIFFELGEIVSEPISTRESERGESSVMIEWSWRVERKYSIAFGSWSGNRKITHWLKKLQGLQIIEVAVEGRLPELVLQLSEGWWVHSFATVESQPQWCLFVRNRTDCNQWIHTNKGKLYLESTLH